MTSARGGEIRIDLIDLKGVTLPIVTGVSADDLYYNPDLWESVLGMIGQLLEHGQKTGMLPAPPKDVSIADAYLRLDPLRFGEKLRFLRQRAGLTQAEAAEMFRASNTWSKATQSTWANWEMRVYPPRGEVVNALAKMFMVRPSYFYGT